MEGTVDKCLALCHALVSCNKKFTLTHLIGKKTFKFYDKELVASSYVINFMQFPNYKKVIFFVKSM